MTSLEELGFLKGCIYETIVSTYDSDGKPHAAPMGALTTDGEKIVLRPFKTTRTYQNIIRNHAAVMNITSDPILFYRSVFGGDLKFKESHMVNSPALEEADGWAELVLESGRDLSRDRSELTLNVVRVELVSKRSAKAYSRAVHAIIESVIHATRIPIFLGGEKNDEALRLVEKVRDYRNLVERVAPNTVYSKLMDDLNGKITEWLRRNEG